MTPLIRLGVYQAAWGKVACRLVAACYYRCLGSDDYRYQGGRVCASKPVRADYADQVVWDHVTALLAGPALIRAEIDRRLERARTSDPVTKKRGQLEQALAKTTASISSMVTAFSEQLLTIDELRARMPDLRARETGLKDQIAALDAQAADRDAYLKLADDVHRMDRLRWVMETSLLKTLAAKHRSTVAKTAARYKATIETPHPPGRWPRCRNRPATAPASQPPDRGPAPLPGWPTRPARPAGANPPPGTRRCSNARTSPSSGCTSTATTSPRPGTVWHASRMSPSSTSAAPAAATAP